jgi:hypothetical protein
VFPFRHQQSPLQKGSAWSWVDLEDLHQQGSSCSGASYSLSVHIKVMPNQIAITFPIKLAYFGQPDPAPAELATPLGNSRSHLDRRTKPVTDTTLSLQ